MNWPHAPQHWLFEPGIYMVTAGTYKKQHHLNTPDRRTFFQEKLIELTSDFGWELQAWAILINHYHFIAKSSDNPETLSRFIGKLHMITAKEFNLQDGQPGRKVWFQFWDSIVTFQKSYLARLNYVMNNPVKHGLINNAQNYPWCSAAWFEMNVPSSFSKTVSNFKTDKLNIYDDY